MSETSLASYSERDLESQLKDLLERMLMQLEKFIETKDDLNQIENELKDYDNLTALVGIIKVIFTNLILKIEKKIEKFERKLDPSLSTKSLRTEEEYEKLEQTVIKYEGEIRNHIRLEQQLKLYAESLQTKLDESEATRIELLDTTKNVMSNLKRENQKYHEQNQKFLIEIAQYKTQVEQLESEQQKRTIENDKLDYEILQLTKNSQQIKSQVKRKPNQNEINKTSSYSEHKLSSQLQESTDYPTQSQGSLKQNYFNMIQYGQHSFHQSKKQSLQHSITQENSKNYQQIKHNSISSIKDILQQAQIKDKKVIISYNQSKNSSQNTSIHQKSKEQFVAQAKSRSGSAKRKEFVAQKQKTSAYS